MRVWRHGGGTPRALPPPGALTPPPGSVRPPPRAGRPAAGGPGPVPACRERRGRGGGTVRKGNNNVLVQPSVSHCHWARAGPLAGPPGRAAVPDAPSQPNIIRTSKNEIRASQIDHLQPIVTGPGADRAWSWQSPPPVIFKGTGGCRARACAAPDTATSGTVQNLPDCGPWEGARVPLAYAGEQPAGKGHAGRQRCPFAPSYRLYDRGEWDTRLSVTRGNNTATFIFSTPASVPPQGGAKHFYHQLLELGRDGA